MSGVLVFFHLIAVASALLSVSPGPVLQTCSIGIGLSPWIRNIDSRETGNTISCTDGLGLSSQGITLESTLPVQSIPVVRYSAVLRSLGHGLSRQGFVLSGLAFNQAPVSLVGACITDSDPALGPTAGLSQWSTPPQGSSINTPRSLKPSNNCGGLLAAAQVGSPIFAPEISDSHSQLKGWQIINPPRPTTAPFPAATIPLVEGNPGWQGRVACNFYFTGDIPQFSTISQQSTCATAGVAADCGGVGACALGNSNCGTLALGATCVCTRAFNAFTGAPEVQQSCSSPFNNALCVVPLSGTLPAFDCVGLGGSCCTSAVTSAAGGTSCVFPLNGAAALAQFPPFIAEETGLSIYQGLSDSTGRSCVHWEGLVQGGQISAPILAPAVSLYGSLGAVVQSYFAAGLRTGWNAQVTVLTRTALSVGQPIVMYANFATGTQTGNDAPASTLAFQLQCQTAAVDETKYVVLSFWGSGNAISTCTNACEYFAYPKLDNLGDFTFADWTADSGISSVGQALSGANTFTFLGAGMPNVLQGEVIIVATCQNVQTKTPTPPFYPLAPAPTPSEAPFPLGYASSFVLTVEQCDPRCTDPSYQQEVSAFISSYLVERNLPGANTAFFCQENPKCIEPADITTLVGTVPTFGRRSLRQAPAPNQAQFATTIVYYTIIQVFSRDIVSTEAIANVIRNGGLATYVSPFSALTLTQYDVNGKPTALPSSSPSSAEPSFVYPSPVAPWSGNCYVTGNCRQGPCSTGCNGGTVTKVTAYAPGPLTCSCNACGFIPVVGVNNVPGLTQYFFTSAGCANSQTQAAATTCCRNVMQDAVCWAASYPDVHNADLDSISYGQWVYRPPSVGSAVPNPNLLNGPTSCPHHSHSHKGLLGLLGLLGIIPCCLCLLSLLLCCIRRKRAEGDVHFATFDPAASQLAGGPLPVGPIPTPLPGGPLPGATVPLPF